MPQSVLEMTKDLVLAEIQAGSLLPEDMHDTARRVFENLMALKSREQSESFMSASAADAPQAPADWRQSITRHVVMCLECGQTFKQLSVRHLNQHNLDGRSYRRLSKNAVLGPNFLPGFWPRLFRHMKPMGAGVETPKWRPKKWARP